MTRHITLALAFALIAIGGCATTRGGPGKPRDLVDSCSVEITHTKVNNKSQIILGLKGAAASKCKYVVTMPLPDPSNDSFTIVHCTDPVVEVITGWAYFTGFYPMGRTKWVKANAEGTDFILQVDDAAKKHRVIMRSFGVDDSTPGTPYTDRIHVVNLRGSGDDYLKKKDQYFEVDVYGTFRGPFMVSTNADDPLRQFVESCRP